MWLAQATACNSWIYPGINVSRGDWRVERGGQECAVFGRRISNFNLSMTHSCTCHTARPEVRHQHRSMRDKRVVHTTTAVNVLPKLLRQFIPSPEWLYHNCCSIGPLVRNLTSHQILASNTKSIPEEREGGIFLTHVLQVHIADARPVTGI